MSDVQEGYKGYSVVEEGSLLRNDNAAA